MIRINKPEMIKFKQVSQLVLVVKVAKNLLAKYQEEKVIKSGSGGASAIISSK